MAFEENVGLQECPLCPQSKKDGPVKFRIGKPIDPDDPELGNYCGSTVCTKKAAKLAAAQAPAEPSLVGVMV